MLISRSASPVLVPESEWEIDGLLSAITVLPEPDGTALRLYYLVRFRDDPLNNVLCIARSEDGRSWYRPDLGDGTNIVMRSSGNITGWGMFMPTRIVYEPADTDAPWKMIYWDRPSVSSSVGICLATSLGGTDWHPMSAHPVIDNVNDAASFLPTHPNHTSTIRNARYLLYQQTWKYKPDLPQERDNLKGIQRVISVWGSAQFGPRKMDGGWVGPITILEPDEDDPYDMQPYWLTPFHTANGYGGLLNCHHTEDQTMDVQLVSSEDGWVWKRELDRQPIVPLGDRGSFDCGMAIVMSPPVTWQGETLILYNGRCSVHDGALRYPDDERSEPGAGIGMAMVEGLDLL